MVCAMSREMLPASNGHKATNGSFSRNCSWKTCLGPSCESIHQLIKLSIQISTVLLSSNYPFLPFLLLSFSRRLQKKSAVTIWSGRSPQLLSQFLLVQDARIRREGRLLVNYSSWKLHFHPPLFGEGRGTRMKNFSRFPDLALGIYSVLALQLFSRN